MNLERWRYAGLRVRCPICGWRLRAFAPDQWDGSHWSGAEVRCPNCGSRPRHRLLWLWLMREPLLTPLTRVLHVAPEGFIADRLRRKVRTYVSVDIDPGRADVQADVTELPFTHRSFDLILCSHVLEHVQDDRSALAELGRVMAEPGVLLLQAPINYDQATTYEDPTISDPAERRARFSQEDHVRVFGRDLVERIEQAGLVVDVIEPTRLGAAADVLYGLDGERPPLRNDLYRCQRAGGSA